MKKFSLFVAMICVAVVSQSAQVQWNSGDLKNKIPADVTSITAYYYTIDASTFAELAASGVTEDIVNQYVNSDGTLKQAGGTQGTTVDVSGSDPSIYVVDSYSTESDENYVVAVYIANSSFGGTYALASPASYINTGTGFDSNNSYNSGLAIDAITYSNAGGWAAVPEPTTIAFLALGLAAIGLKRKVA